MKLKKLELKGFKSFKDKTVIDFNQGITTIVGPNGCGKSNIVDAMIWLMGELSAKQLRGSSMMDVIFSGTTSLPAATMAEVLVVIDNEHSSHPLYTNLDEISITRRLFRDSNSEYLINNNQARLKDIQELFMDTGFGTKGFSIIEQGSIGEMIMAKPAKRLSLIEEAAGLSKFKSRKKESERKLINTNKNLERLDDILSELSKQKESLKRQSQKTINFKKLKIDIEKTELSIFRYKEKKYQDSILNFTNNQIELKDNILEKETKIAGLVSDDEKISLNISEKHQEIQDLSKKTLEMKTKCQSTELELKKIELMIEQDSKNKQMSFTLKKELLNTEKKLKEEETTLKASYDKAKNNIKKLETELVQKQNSINSLRQDLITKESKLNELYSNTNNEEKAKAQSDFNYLEQQVNEIEDFIKEEESNKEEFKNQESEFRNWTNELEQKISENFENLINLKKILSDLNIKIESEDLDKNKAETLKEEKSIHLQKIEQNIFSVNESIKSRTNKKYSGTSSILKWKGDNFSTIYSHIKSIDKKWQGAIETSIEASIDLLIPKEEDNLFSAIDYIKTNNINRCAFFRKNQNITENKNISNAKNILEFIELKENAKDIFKNLFYNIYLVESLDLALKLNKNYPDIIFVSINKDIVSQNTIISGKTESFSVLEKNQELMNLGEEKNILIEELQDLENNINSKSQAKELLKKQIEESKDGINLKEINLAEQRKDLEKSQEDLQKSLENTKSNNNKLESLVLKLDKTKFKKAETLNLLNHAKENLKNRQSELEILDLELRDKKSSLDTMQEHSNDLRVEFAKNLELTKNNERRLISIKEDLNILKNQQDSANKKEDSIITIDQLRSQKGTSLEKIKLQNKEIDQISEKSFSYQKDFDNYQEKKQQITKQIEDNKDMIIKLNNDLNTIALKIQEKEINLKNIKENLKESYPDFLEKFNMIEDLNKENIDETCDRLEKFKAKISKINDVNLLALEEYENCEKRYKFLFDQKNDLIMASKQLKKIIKRIKNIYTERLNITFSEVNAHFKKVFPALFSGGEAKLVLINQDESNTEGHTDGDNNSNDTMDPGIEIFANPSGKKMQNINLLSGGEKALTALSLIFSIFLTKPSPFCLLDEVDAPLDEANIDRFNDLIKEMSKKSQIIVITHNRQTMEAANFIYGITMQTKGVSKLVSVDLAKTKELINN